MTLTEALQTALAQDWISEYITASPDKYDGTPVFVGTSTPAYAPLDLLSEGASRAEVFSEFPGLTKDHLKAAICLASELLLMASVNE